MCGLRSSLHRGAYMLVAGGASTIPIFIGMREISPLYIAGSGFVFWIIVAAFLLRGRVPAALNGRIDGWRMMVAVPVLGVVIWGLVWLRAWPCS